MHFLEAPYSAGMTEPSIPGSVSIQNSTMDTRLYPTAIILPLLAFPAWILCIPPLIWHFSQRNIAAWSLILWMILQNFFNSINPLIWQRDNVSEWFDGQGLCDIEVRIFVGVSVALASCCTMIMRKLANVMDTRNITIAPSKSQVIRDKVLECLWCWGYPGLLMLVYYVVQPIRYYIYGISGCIVAYNLSWVSLALNWIWGPITICFTSYYAVLLLYRLYRYRREFHRLIAARNTTKSRFIRLFVMSMIIVVVLLPYEGWILWLNTSSLTEEFSWSSVHGPGWDTAIKIPAQGQVRMDKWGQVASGYVAFAVFGTGADANNTYKRMLCAIGLGYIFPSLYVMSDSGHSTPPSFNVAQSWCSSLASKARNKFTRNGSVTETMKSTSTRNNSWMLSSHTGSLIPISSNRPILEQHPPQISKQRSFLGHLFSRRSHRQPILPLFGKKTRDKSTEMEKSPTYTYPPGGVFSHAWASDSPIGTRHQDSGGENAVHVAYEFRQEANVRDMPTTNDTSGAVPELL